MKNPRGIGAGGPANRVWKQAFPPARSGSSKRTSDPRCFSAQKTGGASAESTTPARDPADAPKQPDVAETHRLQTACCRRVVDRPLGTPHRPLGQHRLPFVKISPCYVFPAPFKKCDRGKIAQSMLSSPLVKVSVEEMLRQYLCDGFTLAR